jgi:cytochrome bd-type quinol oxidase subunit 1
MFGKLIEIFFATIIILAILPCLISVIVHTIGPVVLTLALIAACVAAYSALQRRGHRARGQRSGAGAERTPVMPHEED